MLPDWVSQAPAPRPAPRRAQFRSLERTLRQSARFFQDTVFAEQIARQPGALQGLGAGAKLLGFTELLVAASFLHHIASFAPIVPLATMAAVLSRVGVRALFNRVWWLLPATWAVLALPAALNLVTPGEDLIALYRFPWPRLGPVALPAYLSITQPGLASACLLITRLFTGLLLALMLALTTRWQDLLRVTHTPVTAPFSLILAMTHRYLFVLVRTLEEMHLARRARTISASSIREQHRWVGNRVAALFARSRRLGELVYQAMLARGYRGEPRALHAPQRGAAEAAWLTTCTLAAAAALLLDRVVLAGLAW